MHDVRYRKKRILGMAVGVLSGHFWFVPFIVAFYLFCEEESLQLDDEAGTQVLAVTVEYQRDRHERESNEAKKRLQFRSIT